MLKIPPPDGMACASRYDKAVSRKLTPLKEIPRTGACCVPLVGWGMGMGRGERGGEGGGGEGGDPT